MSRWEDELRKRRELVNPSKPLPSTDSEFDAVFGANIAETMTEYRLMVTELLVLKLWLYRAFKTFCVLSLFLLIALAYNAYKASFAEANNNLLREHACLTYAAHGQVPPKSAKCPGQ